MSVQLIDVEVTVSFAIDPSKVSLADALRFANDAISAKLDTCRELEDWGGGVCNYFYNGECALEAHVA